MLPSVRSTLMTQNKILYCFSATYKTILLGGKLTPLIITSRRITSKRTTDVVKLLTRLIAGEKRMAWHLVCVPNFYLALNDCFLLEYEGGKYGKYEIVVISGTWIAIV